MASSTLLRAHRVPRRQRAAATASSSRARIHHLIARARRRVVTAPRTARAHARATTRGRARRVLATTTTTTTTTTTRATARRSPRPVTTRHVSPVDATGHDSSRVPGRRDGSRLATCPFAPARAPSRTSRVGRPSRCPRARVRAHTALRAPPVRVGRSTRARKSAFGGDRGDLAALGDTRERLVARAVERCVEASALIGW